MPSFIYIGADAQTGEDCSGAVEAIDATVARQQLASQGLLVSLVEPGTTRPDTAVTPPAKRRPRLPTTIRRAVTFILATALAGLILWVATVYYIDSRNQPLGYALVTTEDWQNYSVDARYASWVSKDVIEVDFKGITSFAPPKTSFDDVLAFLLAFLNKAEAREAKLVQFTRDGEIIATIHPMLLMVAADMWVNDEVDDAKHYIGMCLEWPDGRRRTADQFITTLAAAGSR